MRGGFQKSVQRRITRQESQMDHLLSIIAECEELPVSCITSGFMDHRPPLQVSWIRQAVVYIARDMGISTTIIGRKMNMHHSNCAKAVKAASDRKDVDQLYAAKLVGYFICTRHLQNGRDQQRQTKTGH